MGWAAALLLIAGLILLWLSTRRAKASGLPAGKIIYCDTREWGPVEEPLFDAELNLTGKPDYLVEQGDHIIPVEVKSTRVKDGPYDAHIFQLAAYCMLVERTFAKRPPYGILHYANQTYAIDFTPALENALLDLITEMHGQGQRRDQPRSHESAARCAGCGYREICDQSLK